MFSKLTSPVELRWPPICQGLWRKIGSHSGGRILCRLGHGLFGAWNADRNWPTLFSASARHLGTQVRIYISRIEVGIEEWPWSCRVCHFSSIATLEKGHTISIKQE
jgi:hypothetical protein